MATFMEAMQAAREGKRVRQHQWSDSTWAKWIDGGLCYEYSPNATIRITDGVFYTWIIEEPPPREYTFMEAVEMMEKGKKMRPTHWGSARHFVIDEYGMFHTQSSHQFFGLKEIKGKWIEVNP